MCVNQPLLIGLSGKAGSGKSTVADHLERCRGYMQFAFADALKEVVGKAFRLDPDQLYGGRKEEVDPRWGDSPRFLLQWLGTEVLRARYPDIWIRHLRQDLMDFLSVQGQKPIVVTDVRFVDEAEALQSMGATLIRIERAGAGARQRIKNHASETQLDTWNGFDHMISNNGSREDLFGLVDLLLFNGLEAKQG